MPWPWSKPPIPSVLIESEEIGIARAILLLGFRIDNGLMAIGDAIQALAKAVTALSDRQLNFTLLDGGIIMGAPVTAVVGRTSTSTVVETVKATGVVVPPIGPVVYASDNVAIATIDTNGNWTAVAAGTANLSALDQGNGLTDTVALTVTTTPPPPPVADTLTFTLNP